MEFREARSLVLLADLGSIQRVADAVHLSAPSVHKQLKTLEEELGVPLYGREGRSLKLTEAAETILPYLQQIIAEHDTALRVLDEWKGIKHGLLRIGAGHIVSTYLIPRVLGQFLKQYPGVNASIQSSPVKSLVEKLTAGAIDVALLVAQELNDEPHLSSEGYDIVCDVVDLEMVLVSGAPPEKKRCSIHSLSEVPFILYEKGLAIDDVMARFFNGIGFHPRVVVRCDYTEAIKVMVQKAPGVSLLPLWAVEDEIRSGVVWPLNVHEPLPSLRIVLARRKRKYAPPAVAAFIEAIREYASDSLPNKPARRKKADARTAAASKRRSSVKKADGHRK
jgi:DNA-binding transcriptional LysR family regulator